MYKKLFFIILTASVFFILRSTDVLSVITFENLKLNADSIKGYVHERYLLSVFLYVSGYTIVTGLALPGAVVISLCGGYVFGLAGGLVYSICGATAGASLSFFISRYLLGGWLNTKYAGQLEKFNCELDNNGYLYMLTLRLIPIFPFFLINLLAGLTNIRFRTFLWTTFFGMMPGGFVFIYAGNRLSEISSPDDIFSLKILSVLVLFGLMALVPVTYKKMKKK